MYTKLKFNRLFVYSQEHSCCFNTVFGNEINIVYGKNTSGKSTLFQSILYAMGINENNKLLTEILDKDVIFRLDCSILRNKTIEKLTFIREYETLIIVQDNRPTRKFIGISGNSSAEHVRLKDYISELFGFTLMLEQKGKVKSAPLEAMMLPYYVSQAVGWVYLRKSFGNLDFFKNFREDYLDYYTGIESFVDREKKTELERLLRMKDSEIEFYTSMQESNQDLAISRLSDEKYVETSINYIEEFSERQKKLINLEKEFTLRCNELSNISKRLSVLRKVSKNHLKQSPKEGVCPTCSQELPSSLETWYKYYQEENDTKSEIGKYADRQKKIKSKINSLRKAIATERIEISRGHELLQKRDEREITYSNWLDIKANTKLLEKCEAKLGRLTVEKSDIENQLREFKTEKEILAERNKKSANFASLFGSYLVRLGIDNLSDRKYNYLYEITAFPMQGVELHKTVMAYHFAFNKFIKGTGSIHRIPFMLDAVFKEDIESDNKELILNFVSKHKPDDTQMILSIAETKNENGLIEGYNSKYFGGSANLICIGESQNERAFLGAYNTSYDSYVSETLEYINGITD